MVQNSEDNVFPNYNFIALSKLSTLMKEEYIFRHVSFQIFYLSCTHSHETTGEGLPHTTEEGSLE